MSEINIFEDTSSDIKIVKLMWRIIDFSHRGNGTILSPVSRTSVPDILGNWRISLRRYLKNISVDVYQENTGVKPTYIAFYLFDEKHDIATRNVSKWSGDRCSYYFRGEDKKMFYLPNGELLTLCEIVIKVPSQNKSPAKFEPPPCQLAEDWGKMLSSSTLSDVTIAVGGAELRAHKAVLAARSAVFAAMFSNQMRETETSIVEVTDMDAEVFQAMLEFMYTGKEMSQTCGAYDLLLAAATKYQLEGLKVLCEKALCEALSLDNVLENLALADLHNAPRLKEQCISFVMQHRAEILTSSSWDTFIRSHPSLVTKIISTIGH